MAGEVPAPPGGNERQRRGGTHARPPGERGAGAHPQRCQASAAPCRAVCSPGAQRRSGLGRHGCGESWYPPPPQELHPPEKPPPSTASIALTGSWNFGPWGASRKARRCLLQTGWPSPPNRWLKRLLDLARRSPGEKTPPRGVTILHPSAAPPWGPSVQSENEPSFPLLALGHPQSFLERRPAPQPSVSSGPELAEAPGKGERAGEGGVQKLECRLQTFSLRVVM
ncbi:uncharacterized protein LOC121021241 [Herpailurus yagouaroundi]|uniref:uncharacterized protein LOC121021241 n=1 Tax=Herpailurus yagouaroundi TaxID=1608482 RepID=UPI001AD75082|nr:uncharacterized protein LOC121021241 [Puma yagouaroundi]